MNDVGSNTLEECLFPGCNSNAVHPKDVPAHPGSMLGFCEPFNSSYADSCLALDLCQALLLLRCSRLMQGKHSCVALQAFGIYAHPR